MTALIVIGCILLFFWLVGMLRANLILIYDGQLVLSLRVLFLNIRLVPGKKKIPNPEHYSPGKYRKMLAKKAKKEQKKQANAQKKLEKKKQSEAKKKTAAPQNMPARKKPQKSVADILDLVWQILEMVKGLVRSFGKHFRIEAVRLKITVAGEDAAKTAIMYGMVCQGVAYLIEILSTVTNFKAKHRENISVEADFLSEKSTADLHLIFRLRVWHLFAMVFAALGGFIRKRFFDPEKSKTTAKGK
ncbi:MAG: DUF2953 domain-containing protein [Eubacteriales bacterium]